MFNIDQFLINEPDSSSDYELIPLEDIYNLEKKGKHKKTEKQICIKELKENSKLETALVKNHKQTVCKLHNDKENIFSLKTNLQNKSIKQDTSSSKQVMNALILLNRVNVNTPVNGISRCKSKNAPATIENDKIKQSRRRQCNRPVRNCPVIEKLVSLPIGNKKMDASVKKVAKQKTFIQNLEELGKTEQKMPKCNTKTLKYLKKREEMMNCVISQTDGEDEYFKENKICNISKLLEDWESEDDSIISFKTPKVKLTPLLNITPRARLLQQWVDTNTVMSPASLKKSHSSKQNKCDLQVYYHHIKKKGARKSLKVKEVDEIIHKKTELLKLPELGTNRTVNTSTEDYFEDYNNMQ